MPQPFSRSAPRIFAILLLTNSFIVAQDRTISVTATGSVITKPDLLKFRVVLRKTAATEKKAKAEFDELRKAFRTNFNVMKFKGLSIKSMSKSLAPQPKMQPGHFDPFGGGAAPRPDASSTDVSFSEEFQLALDGIDKMGGASLEQEVLNYVGELKKLKLSPTGFSTHIQDKSRFQEQIMQKAMDKAKSKAAILAKLAGGSLGKVISVTEQRGPFPDDYTQLFPQPYAASVAKVTESVEVSTSIRVVFELKE